MVFELLKKEAGNAYSNLTLDKALNESKISAQEKSFVSRLFYGTIERKITLDYVISNYSTKKINKIDLDVLIILRMAIYQLLYMNSVPDSAAVNEAVKLVKKAKKMSASGFVNGILRSFIRDEKKFKLPKATLKRKSVEYSCPLEVISKLYDSYDRERVDKFLLNSLEKHTTYIRTNTLKISTEELIKVLAENKIIAEKFEKLPDCLVVKELSSLERCKPFKDGMFAIQDLSSQLCCHALGAKDGDEILDACSAPGGKSFTIAFLTGDNAKITSTDLHSSRVNLINSGAKRFGIKSINAFENDSCVANPKLGEFDKILCDVPCSGLGVIRAKPEIKYKSLERLPELTEIQYKILENCASHLKIGGELIYSTCSIFKEENDDIIWKFLENHKEYAPCSFLENFGEPFSSETFKATIMSEDFDSEGFFISKIKRVK